MYDLHFFVIFAFCNQYNKTNEELATSGIQKTV